MKTKIQQPNFDWSRLPLEMFRGPNLSFPVSMEILVAPSFDATVLTAVNSFVDDFTGHPILDAEYDSFQTVILDSTTDPEGNIHKLKPNNFGLRMKYICEAEKVVFLTVGPPENLITRH